jgi:hypothetical protein
MNLFSHETIMKYLKPPEIKRGSYSPRVFFVLFILNSMAIMWECCFLHGI